jgi:hypothetical protein
VAVAGLLIALGWGTAMSFAMRGTGGWYWLLWNGGVLALYGWMICSTGISDRVLGSAVVYLLLGYFAILWVPLAGTIVAQFGVVGGVPATGVGAVVALAIVNTFLLRSWTPLAWGAGGASLIWVLSLTGTRDAGASALIAHAATGAALFTGVRREARTVPLAGHCRGCRYPVADLDRCPECGLSVGEPR